MSRKFMSSKGFITGGGKVFKAGFHGGDSGVGDHRRKGMRFISHHEIERRLTGDGVRPVIVGEFGVGDRLRPGCGVVAAKDAKVGFNFLIDSFGFAVGLRMISGGKGEVVV